MTVLITGANRGIGHGLFEHYSQLHGNVIGTSRSGAAPYVRLEVSDPASQFALASKLDGAPIDLLICNAGVYQDKGETLEAGYPSDMWANTFAANVAGVFHTMQALLPNLRNSDNARIAIIPSQMASQTNANGGSYIYRASKAASLNLGRNLAVDLGRDGIAVGVYHPGWVVTDMGGNGADIQVSDAVDGLTARFEELSLATTGCFLNWDGSAQSY